MISFRYHIVTIVAVFLALAIGLLGGGAFVQPALQQQLEDQTAELRRTNAAQREDIDDLHRQTAAMEAFSDAALPYLTRDRLLGTRVVIVTQDGVADPVLAEAQRALGDAGAEVVAVLTARDAIASDDVDTQQRLGDIIGRPTALGVDLPSLTAGAVADRLAGGHAPENPEEDLLARLLSAGFLTSTDEGTALDEVGGPGQVVVVLGGGLAEEPVLTPADFGVPLASRLVELQVEVAAGESTETPPAVSLVTDLRNELGDAVVTVDNLELSMGGAALVLGIDGLATRGGGVYGFGDGADPLPPLP